ncbi:hypothetical protein HHL11_04185 [Ramlibacter sp. G-1-2-2]|uniref:DUF2158 domain-containing protein n=1 Tax=Ramlibacter agri TaxID=2728837 RepID=A0A848GXQ7_9BURK|nr:hypothetical protein [Ramlibacter agri]NML42937.1 hypothetical protein [Ramlibacter agri]
MDSIRKGDRVTAGSDGPVMTVLACSQHTAVCSWEQDGAGHQGTFELRELRSKAAQPAQQQPQPEGDADQQ